MSRILVGIPTYDKKVDIEILVSMIQLPEKYPQHILGIDFIASSIITDARNYLVRRFLESDFEWLYFWDADVVIRDTTFLEKLFETAEKFDADIVGGIYRIKHNRGLYAAGHYRDNRVVNVKLGEVTEPQEIDLIATGSMLIHRKVLEALSDPWFTFDERAGDMTISEDFNFCIHAKEKGFKIAVDPRFATYHFGYASWEHSLA